MYPMGLRSMSLASNRISRLAHRPLNSLQLKSKLGQRQLVWLVFLVFVAVALRVLPIWDGAFAYMYDHARDSLAIWEMWELKKPALIGAQTSIPGLYNGPAWYYLALPLNVLLGFHPVAGAVTVVLLVV